MLEIDERPVKGGCDGLRKPPEWGNVKVLGLGALVLEFVPPMPSNSQDLSPRAQTPYPIMKKIFLLSTVLITSVAAGAGQGGLEEAKKALMAGRYEEAAEMFAPLAKEDPAAVLGLARCSAERGDYEKAVKILQDGGQKAVLLAEVARLCFERGDYAQAQQAADAALKLDTKIPLARLILAELHRAYGRLSEAENGYRKLIRYYNDSEIDDPEALRWIGEAAAQYARWNGSSDQFDFLVNELYADCLKLQADYWPAKYETGLLFLEKYNYADAAEEFRAALNINPRAAEVHAALGLVWLAQHDNAKAEKEVDRALELNPQLLDALLAKADLLWANLQVPETLEMLEKKALPLNPQNEETLGRLAACYLLLDGKSPLGEPTEKPKSADALAVRQEPRAAGSRFENLLKTVTAQNPHCGEFFYTLARALDEHNKQPQAEKYYREAMRALPKQSGPSAQLGLLYMHMGRESDARPLLRAAFDGDPFNVRVHNMLNLLDVLDKMERKETAHLLLRFEKADSLLGRYAENRVEEMYQELCRHFGYTPPRKTAVDIFNNAEGQNGHAWFSTRVSGLPFIGTVAASTGHLVAMVSPGDEAVPKKFNWVRVLRHELTHVVTLQQTEFNIPHWYTEGLAVTMEDHPRPAEWNQLLLARVPKGKVFNLDTIDSGFTRPESSGNWTMAYCQAQLYVDYMRELGGEDSLKKMLDAYTQGLNTAEAVRRSFGISKEEFEKGYVDFLHRQIEGLKGLHWADVDDIEALKKAAEEHPDDAGALAGLANGYIHRGAEKEATEASDKALKLTPNDPLATYVKARVLVKTDKKEKIAEAVKLLEKTLDLKSPEPNGLNLLAGLKLKAGEHDEAARLYALGEQLDAANPQWTRSLARVYASSKNEQKLMETLRRLAAEDMDDLASRKKLAELAIARKDYPAAEQAAREALEIDVCDVDSHVALAESWVGRHNSEKAIEHWEIAVELAPDKPQYRFVLANAYHETGKTAKAKEALEKLLEIAPDHEGARELLEQIEIHSKI
jgi:cellulose synthase operon protein C